MKILVTGSNGQLGQELATELRPLGELLLVDIQELDITNAEQVNRAVADFKPALIVNTAAYTAVDRAEEEKELAMTVNGKAPGILAHAAKKNGAGFIHYSTDYVFDGTKNSPYTEDDTPCPINWYGETKLAGERAVMKSGAPYLIFRTSWLYGTTGNNFMLTMLRLFNERDEIKIVADQRGTPTWSRVVAQTTAEIVKKLHEGAEFKSSLEQVSGLYHLTCEGQTTWHGFTTAIMENVKTTGVDNLPKLIPVQTSEYKTPAKRPLNSTLSLEKVKRTFGVEIPDWRDALNLCMKKVEL
ncbi:dTDP-4-dehydrorhamnose reductase [hydrothermal vent metagenome]|uniref:dTDP-4-dehydrorhamnose reductase n=1 Tax=hydrothermal vent metagenome TaxID=652676 RepID=A0A3B1BV24_9ZZZZ